MLDCDDFKESGKCIQNTGCTWVRQSPVHVAAHPILPARNALLLALYALTCLRVFFCWEREREREKEKDARGPFTTC